MSNLELKRAIGQIMGELERLTDATYQVQGVQGKVRKLLLNTEEPLVEAYNLLDEV